MPQIVRSERRDKANDIRDKAVAMEAYFQQAKNTEAERRACEIRLRAERKAGQLLAKLRRAQGKRTDRQTSGHDGPKSFTDQLNEHGVTGTQAKRWQALAGVPEEDFEAALAGDEQPTTNGIIAKPQKMPETSLWLWGRLRDFERDGLLLGQAWAPIANRGIIPGFHAQPRSTGIGSQTTAWYS